MRGRGRGAAGETAGGREGRGGCQRHLRRPWINTLISNSLLLQKRPITKPMKCIEYQMYLFYTFFNTTSKVEVYNLLEREFSDRILLCSTKKMSLTHLFRRNKAIYDTLVTRSRRTKLESIMYYRNTYNKFSNVLY